MPSITRLLSLAMWVTHAIASPVLVSSSDVRKLERRRENDWSCSSAKHPNPVVLLHGAGANEDLNFFYMEPWLQKRGFCTFALTYGRGPPPYPDFVGGVAHMADSAQEIIAFIKTVQQRTGAAKIDLVGHSEGALQSLYIPKVYGISSMLGTIVAIAPPTHGLTASGILTLIEKATPIISREEWTKIFDAVGCGICDDAAFNGPVIQRLNDGLPILQPGNNLTIIASRHDETVTPTDTALVQEKGVHNIYVQDYCPLDIVGHLGEAIDPNVFNLILNSLENQVGRRFDCSLLTVPLV